MACPLGPKSGLATGPIGSAASDSEPTLAAVPRDVWAPRCSTPSQRSPDHTAHFRLDDPVCCYQDGQHGH